MKPTSRDYGLRGSFCAALALIAKYPLHIPVLEWLFVLIGGVLIAYAFALAAAGRDE